MSSFPSTTPQETFSRREREILGLIAEGLSNHTIAQKLYLSLDTVKWYNKQIYGKLGVSSRTQAIARAREVGLFDRGAVVTAQVASRPRVNLPAPLTSYIGRRMVIDAVLHRLSQPEARLLTLTGPAGVGKTRLSLQVAYRLRDVFKGGISFISLAPLNDPILVASTIAHCLGIHETAEESIQDAVKGMLSDKQWLLILDNFEHLLPAAPLVTDLLVAVPGLKILATSRAALQVYGEQLFPVPPLSLPDPQNLLLNEDLSSFESVQLFIERARAIRPDFTLDRENARAIAEICLRLDGLPLAIELAAARSRSLPPPVMLAHFDGRRDHFPFTMLTGGPIDVPARHQTLHNAIAWSFGLLGEEEKILFYRLATFSGGCTSEAVLKVCADPPESYPSAPSKRKGRLIPGDMLAMLESLVDKCLLIQSEVDGEARFDMLDMVRAFALEQLELSGEAELLRERHAVYYLDLVEAISQQTKRLDGQAWPKLLEQEQDNLRAVLSWSLFPQADAQVESRLRAALNGLGKMQLPFSERRQWVEKAITLLHTTSPASQENHRQLLEAELWGEASSSAYFQGDYQAARILLERNLSLGRKLHNKAHIAGALIAICWNTLALDASSQTKSLADEALALGKEAEIPDIVAHALNHLAWLAWLRGDYGASEQLFIESLARYQEAQNLIWVAIITESRGSLLQAQNDQQRARELYLQGLTLCCQLSDRWGIGNSLEKIARSFAAQRQFVQAVRLFSAAQNVLESMGYALEPTEQLGHEVYFTMARAGLDKETYTNAWDEGRDLPLELAIQEAFRVQETVTSH